MKGIVILVSVLSLLFQNINGQSLNFEDNYRFSDIVFIGKVTYENANSKAYCFDNEGVHFNIEVVEYFKGAEFNIKTWSYFSYPRSWDYCFDLGKEYFICANVEPVNTFLDMEGEFMIIERKKASKEILKARELSKIPKHNLVLDDEEKQKILHKRELKQTTIASFLLGAIFVGVIMIVTSRIKKTKPNKPQ